MDEKVPAPMIHGLRDTPSTASRLSGLRKDEKAGRVRFWPLPDARPALPSDGDPGSFWEDRGDRHHAGLDLYAPAGSAVVSIEDGIVV